MMLSTVKHAGENGYSRIGVLIMDLIYRPEKLGYNRHNGHNLACKLTQFCDYHDLNENTPIHKVVSTLEEYSCG